MKLNYQYRIYPETHQIEKLNSWLRICRYLYNRWIGQCLSWWETNRCSIDSCSLLVCHLPELENNPVFEDLKSQLPELKEDLIKVGWSGELLDLKSVYSSVLQDVYTSRVKPAFKRFISGDSNGKKSGRPRIKSESSYRSFKYPQADNSWIDTSAHILKLPKVGGFHIRLHRPLPSGFALKTVQVIKKADGWYVNLCLEDPTVPEFKLDEIEPTWDNTLGMDAVLYGDDYLALSDGQKLPSVKFYRHAEKSLNKAKSKKDKAKRGSRRRRKLAKKISKTSQRIARARKDHAFKTAHELVRKNKKFFVHEDLKLKNLTKRNKAKQDENGKYLPNGQSAKSGLNKSWLDAAFGQFFDILEYIAGKAGARVIAVNPEYTSQILSYKDEFVFTQTDIREFFDVELGLKVDRDINAAINLLRVGLGVFPTIKRRRGKVIITVTATASTSKEVLDVLRRIATASQNSVDEH